jgi:DNA-binding HxlR family transcriptional regulator
VNDVTTYPYFDIYGDQVQSTQTVAVINLKEYYTHGLTLIAECKYNLWLQKVSQSAGQREVMTKSNQISRSSCPVSCALDILGDKWTLLVVRDLIFFRKRYFGDFQDSPEKIATNILSDRLKKLEECHLLLRRRDPANARKIIYMPTEKCVDLAPPIMELVR